MNFNFNNRTLIILIVGIAAVYALGLNEMNVASVCVAGLIGYLSKDNKSVPEPKEETDCNDEEPIGEQ